MVSNTKKTRTKKTSQIKKAECILGSVDKNGLIKPNNNNNNNNDFNCLIAGHRPCLVDMNHFIKGKDSIFDELYEKSDIDTSPLQI